MQKLTSANGPGAHFVNDFRIVVQIRWEIRLAVSQLLAIGLLQNVHVVTAQLLCHVQNLVVITVFESVWNLNDISNEFE